MTALQVLRIFGPCLVEDVARHAGLSWSEAERALNELYAKGQACVSDDGWDLSELGVRAFKLSCKPPRRSVLTWLGRTA